jgi:asparagine synthase (glutamine-hydrolysing)
MSSQHVTVVLTGDGGDESFGGYQRYVAMGTLGRVPVPGFTRRPLRSLGSAIVRRGGANALRAFGHAAVVLAEPVPRRYAHFMSYFAPEQKLALYSDALRDDLVGVDSYELLCQAFEESRARSDVCRLMDVDVQTYLPGDLLPKVDITTMSCSLEARSPFLDHHLMEWAAGLPGRLKVRSRTTKYLLKHAMMPWLPNELITRQKQGFGVPLASWLRDELRDLSWDVLTDSTARSRGLFRPEAVASLLSEHGQGVNHSTRIWALIQFELWHRNFIDDRAARDQVPFPSA